MFKRSNHVNSAQVGLERPLDLQGLTIDEEHVLFVPGGLLRELLLYLGLSTQVAPEAPLYLLSTICLLHKVDLGLLGGLA